MTSGSPVLSFGPDLYQQLAKIAERGRVVPVMLHGSVPAWLLTQPDDIAAAARDYRLTSDGAVLGRTGGSSVKFGFMGMDGPDHLRLRRMVTATFTPRRTARLRPHIEQVVGELLDAIAPTGQADLVFEFARPLPVRVICELLGVPLDERAHFEDATNAMLRPAVRDPSQVDIARAELYGYLTALIRHKRNHPADDLLSVLVAAGEANEQELVEIAALLLVAGYETTADLIGTGILALITNPDQLAMLRDRPVALRGAVDELVRYCGPVAIGVTRYTRQQVTIAGMSIPAGERIVLGLGAANRAPDRFPKPNSLDVTRADGPHFGFGQGPHYCPGAALARLEAEIALGAVLRRLDGLTVCGTPTWHHSIFYGLDHLPVSFQPSYGPPGSTELGAKNHEARVGE